MQLVCKTATLVEMMLGGWAQMRRFRTEKSCVKPVDVQGTAMWKKKSLRALEGDWELENRIWVTGDVMSLKVESLSKASCTRFLLSKNAPQCAFSIELGKLTPYVFGENSEVMIKIKRQHQRWCSVRQCHRVGDLKKKKKKEGFLNLHFDSLISKS